MSRVTPYRRRWPDGLLTRTFAGFGGTCARSPRGSSFRSGHRRLRLSCFFYVQLVAFTLAVRGSGLLPFLLAPTSSARGSPGSWFRFARGRLLRFNGFTALLSPSARLALLREDLAANVLFTALILAARLSFVGLLVARSWLSTSRGPMAGSPRGAGSQRS